MFTTASLQSNRTLSSHIASVAEFSTLDVCRALIRGCRTAACNDLAFALDEFIADIEDDALWAVCSPVLSGYDPSEVLANLVHAYTRAEGDEPCCHFGSDDDDREWRTWQAGTLAAEEKAEAEWRETMQALLRRIEAAHTAPTANLGDVA